MTVSPTARWRGHHQHLVSLWASEPVESDWSRPQRHCPVCCGPLLAITQSAPVPLTDSAAAACEQAMVYSVSKAALISLTKSEAIDLAPSGIRVRAPRPRSC